MRNGNGNANAMTELAGQLSTDCECVDSVLGHFTVEYIVCCVVHVVHGEWGALTRSN